MSKRGRIIVIEGVDGVGKSTLAQALADRLGALYLHEPGGTVVGDKLSDVCRGWRPRTVPEEKTRSAFYVLSRVLVCQRVLETVHSGQDVVLDRYALSTLAYQLPLTDFLGRRRLHPIAEVNKTLMRMFAEELLVPDFVFLINPNELSWVFKRISDRREDRLGEGNRVKDTEIQFMSDVWNKYQLLSTYSREFLPLTLNFLVDWITVCPFFHELQIDKKTSTKEMLSSTLFTLEHKESHLSRHGIDLSEPPLTLKKLDWLDYGSGRGRDDFWTTKINAHVQSDLTSDDEDQT